ncbi:MAG: hypothetical protein PVI86_01690 [Phycisphaerae bacterium]|jgi:hypothetical protein
MLTKVVAIMAFVSLPLTAAVWHRSHSTPRQYRYDVTAYKSLRIYLKDGKCGLRLLSLPTKTAGRSEFKAKLDYNARQMREGLVLHSTKHGPYRITWLVFPLWVPTLALAAVGVIPLSYGPARQSWRRWRGCCLVCGYNLYGNRSGRCPECGNRVRPARRSPNVMRAFARL